MLTGAFEGFLPKLGYEKHILILTITFFNFCISVLDSLLPCSKCRFQTGHHCTLFLS